MPKINLVASHCLAQDEAILRVKTLLNNLETQYADKINGLHEEWDGDNGKFSFTAMGFPVSGTISVKLAQVEIFGDLPFAATLFKGRIESMIKDRASKLLA